MSENDASTSWFGRVDGTHEDADLVLGEEVQGGEFGRIEVRTASTDLSLSVWYVQQYGLCNNTWGAVSSVVIGHTMHVSGVIM